MTAPPCLKRLSLPLAALAALAAASTSFAPPLPKGKENPAAQGETEEAKPAVDLAKAATDERLARQAARNRAVSTNNLKQIGLAMHNYLDVHGRFPADVVGKGGKVLLSWRVLLLPYLEQDNLYRQLNFNQSVEKSPATQQVVKLFLCPSDAPPFSAFSVTDATLSPVCLAAPSSYAATCGPDA